MSISMQLVQDVAQQTGVNVNICKAVLESNGGDKSLAVSNIHRWLKKEQVSAQKYIELLTHFDASEKTMVIIKAISDNPDVFTYPNVLDYLDTLMASEAEQDPVRNEQVEKERVALENELGYSIEHKTFGITKSHPLSLLTSYIHQSKYGSIVEIIAGNADALSNPKLKQFAFDLAMHVVAFRPICIHPAEFPESYKSKAISEFERELSKSGKGINLWEPIIEGKMSKIILNNSLMTQTFIRSAEAKVSQAKELLEEELKTSININKIIFVD